jgi:hypothetical protein
MKLSTLFRTKKSWCQGWVAKDSAGHPVETNNRNAVSFCLLGGLRRCYFKPGDINRYVRMRGRIEKCLPLNRSISGFNDDPSTTFADIRRLIKKAKV